MGEFAVGVVDSYGDAFGVHGDLHPLPLAVGDDGELGVGRADFSEGIFMDVAAEHQIDSGIVEERKEFLRHIQIAVPCVFDLRRDVAEHDPPFSVLPVIAFDNALEPFGLLVEVRLRAESALVLDVVVDLVLTAVHHKEEELAVLERVVRAVLREVEIFREPEGILASVLVVAPGHVERGLVREEVAGRL